MNSVVRELKGMLADRLMWWSWRLHLRAWKLDKAIPPPGLFTRTRYQAGFRAVPDLGRARVFNTRTGEEFDVRAINEPPEPDRP